MLDRASIHESAFDGATQRVGRLGVKFEIDYEVPKLRFEADGRRAIALLQRAQREGGFVEVHQPGLRIGACGQPMVDGVHAGGTTLNLKGCTARYAVRQGQVLNLTIDGRRYLHFAAENAVLDAEGAGAVLLTTPMRKHLVGDEAVELARPVIEGWLDGNERSWTLDAAWTVGLKFTVRERA